MCKCIMSVSLIIISLISLISRTTNENVTITIDQGELTGVVLKSRNGTKYQAFMGIPYAKPPVGELRFSPPQPPESWNGIRNASELPPPCIHKEHFLKTNKFDQIQGEENCLYLSVYTSQTENKTDLNLPVMVWIHGGAYMEGSASLYHPDYFMDYPIILVHINYRLGILGFLSTGDEILPGNNGMKDQVAALKWVQKNIAAFGGDRNKVTIFGESAGASSVHYHMYSPLSQGLFHRAISQSGTALAAWAHTPREKAKKNSLKLGELTNCPISSSETLVNCLRKLPADVLIQICDKFRTHQLSSVIPFSIVPELHSNEAFINENPWYQDINSTVPWILGFNSGEGGVVANHFLSQEDALRELNEGYKSLFPAWYNPYKKLDDENKILEMTEKIKKFYFKNKEIGRNERTNLVDFFTDTFFSYSTLEATHRYRGPVYFYYNDHKNKYTFNNVFGTLSEDLGVCHCDELISLFYMPTFFPKIIEGDDYEISKIFINYWLNFAYYGNPNNPNKELWKPVQSKNIEYLHVTTEKIMMKKGLLEKRYSFWKTVGVLEPLAKRKEILKDEL